MNTAELNLNALVAAAKALLGTEEKLQILSELYLLLDNAEKIGEASGYGRGLNDGENNAHADKMSYFNEGYEQGQTDNDVGAAHDAGYDQGYNDGYVDGVDAKAAGFEGLWEQGFDEGYEQARFDLGECPIVDQDFDFAGYGPPQALWDTDEDGYLRRAVHAMMD